MSSHSRNQVLCTYLKANKYGSYSFLYNSTSSARGVGIIYSDSLKLNVRDVYRDPNENFILINSTLNNQNVTIGSVYLPSKASEEEITHFTEKIDKFENNIKIIGGDFNSTPWTCTIQIT